MIESIAIIAIFCLVPILWIWLDTRRRMNETNSRTQIVMAAIEKNPDMDLEELMKKITPKGKMLKEKLLEKLLGGCITSVIGLGLIALGIYLSASGSDEDGALTAISFGVMFLAVGSAFIINYGVGKKMLAKEIEAEEKRLTSQK